MSLKKATLINSAAKYYSVICAVIVNMILSRILTPNEYGVVAVAMVFIAFFTLFSDLGFGVAYIQNKDLTKDDRNALFTFLIYVGLLLFVIFYVFAYGIAWFYESNLYIPVAQLLGVNLFLTAVNVIPNAELLKQQRFKTVGYSQMFAATISAVCAVFFALHDFSYYSIVLQAIIRELLLTCIFIYITKCKFIFKVACVSIQKVMVFSIGQVGFNFINYFSRNLDNLLIGKFLGRTALGYYDKAYFTTTYTLTNFSSIIGNSIQPVLAIHQEDKQYIYEKFQKVFLFLSVIGAYLSISFNLSAHEIISILYGTQWNDSIVAFSYLSLSLFAQLPLNITGSFYQVLNNTKLLAFVGGISAILLGSGIIIGLLLGTIEMVALGYFIAQCFNLFVVLKIMETKLFKRNFKFLFVEVLKIILVAIFSCVILKILFVNICITNTFLLFSFKMISTAIVFLVLCYIMHLEKYVFLIIYPKYCRK